MLRFSQVTPPGLSIAVICGGDSSEREISLQTGTAIFDALTGLGHQCVTIDPSLTELQKVDWLDFDVAAIAMHGEFGEDGQLQSLLEKHGLPFTGSDSRCSALAFSKADSKKQFVASGVPTPDYAPINVADTIDQIAAHVEDIGYPVVVKPNAQGSSIGITIVHSGDQLPAAIETCFRYGDIGLIEKAIVGSEWTVAVIDNQPLPPICIEAKQPFYDYKAKYNDNQTTYHFDKADPEFIEAIQAVGLAACQSVGTKGIARADLRVDEQNRPWVLEVNTIPGMTTHSLVPKAAAMAGMTFAQMCQRMITSCMPEQIQRRRSA